MAFGASVRMAHGALVAGLLASSLLSGCASVAQTDTAQLQTSAVIADHVPKWANGEPSGIPDRPAPSAYLSVFTTHPPHEKKLLTDDEEKRAEAELTSARNGTSALVKTAVTAEKQRAAETAALSAAHDRMAVQQSGAPTSN
jgi:hypothetical protein